MVAAGVPLYSALGAKVSDLFASDIHPEQKVKIWDAKQYNLTISFELPNLPGEIFSIILPELLSERRELILPYTPGSLATWNIKGHLASYVVEVPHKLRLDGLVRFRQPRIECWLKVTNLSNRSWKYVTTFTCVSYHGAPHFNDPSYSRTYLPVAHKWKSVAELFKEHPGDEGAAFFGITGKPALNDFAVCRAKDYEHAHHPQLLSAGCACVESSDGEWVVGISAKSPAYVYVNREDFPQFKWQSIHADPLIRSIAPGENCLALSTIYIFRGTKQDFMAIC